MLSSRLMNRNLKQKKTICCAGYGRATQPRDSVDSTGLCGDREEKPEVKQARNQKGKQQHTKPNNN
jgi:hypothetical protein